MDKKEIETKITGFKGTGFIIMSPHNFGGVLFFFCLFGAFTYRGLHTKSLPFFIIGLVMFTVSLYFIAKAKEDMEE